MESAYSEKQKTLQRSRGDKMKNKPQTLEKKPVMSRVEILDMIDTYLYAEDCDGKQIINEIQNPRKKQKS